MADLKFDGLVFDSYEDFYQRQYGSYLTGAFSLPGEIGSFVEARQPPGDFSDAPVPEHVFAHCVGTACDIAYDYGDGRRKSILPPDCVGIIPAGAATTVILHSDCALRALAVPAAVAASIAGPDISQALARTDGSHRKRPLIFHIMSALREAAARGDDGDSLLSESLLAALLQAALQPGITVSKPAGRLADWQVRRVCALIDDRLSHRITLRELADDIDLSTYHFCRAFKASTGLAPHQYQVARRVERAKDLLVESKANVTAIAAAVGYENPNQLARVFRKTAGISPTRYRRERLA